jgi:CRP/FNR family transcriptional regulator, cyclic AMP receptor protein
MAGALVKILDQDAELGADLEGERLAQARAQAAASTLEIARGQWDAEQRPERLRGGLGLLVLDGLMLRRVGLSGRYGAELVIHGDILRPWEREVAVASLPRSATWWVLERSRVAVLDIEFSKRIAPFPEIHGQLLGRALRRSRHLAVQMAIVHHPKVETRLKMLLWHLADRCGTVRADGIYVPIRLTHANLSELLAASRPTVSAAVAALQRDGWTSRLRRGWLLHGAPPGELRAIATSALTG